MAASVTVKTEDGYRVTATAGDHRITLDEKTDVGGTDAGPGAKEMLLAAVASCGAITMKMYAERKGWPLEGAEIVSTLEPSATPGQPPKVVQTITLKGPLDAEQKERLREIAGKCPVHKTLDGPLVIEETLG